MALTACTLLPIARRWLARATHITLAMMIANIRNGEWEWWMQRCILEEGICDRNYKNDHFLIHHVTQYSLGRYTLGLVLYLIFAKCHIYLMFWFCKSLCVVLHNVIKDNIFWTLLLVVFLHVVVADNRFIKLFYQTRPLSAPFLFRTYFVFSQSRWLD